MSKYEHSLRRETSCALIKVSITSHCCLKDTINRDVFCSPHVSPSGLVLSVAARRLREASAVGSTFEMSCQAHVQNLPPGTAFSILVLSEEAVGSPSRKLASLGPEMVLQLEEDRDLMLVKTGKKEFQFRIPAVQETDRGFYWCEMKAWTRQPGEDWVEMAKGVSNKVQIHFIHKGTEYNIISQKMSISTI